MSQEDNTDGSDNSTDSFNRRSFVQALGTAGGVGVGAAGTSGVSTAASAGTDQSPLKTDKINGARRQKLISKALSNAEVQSLGERLMNRDYTRSGTDEFNVTTTSHKETTDRLTVVNIPFDTPNSDVDASVTWAMANSDVLVNALIRNAPSDRKQAYKMVQADSDYQNHVRAYEREGHQVSFEDVSVDHFIGSDYNQMYLSIVPKTYELKSLDDFQERDAKPYLSTIDMETQDIRTAGVGSFVACTIDCAGGIVTGAGCGSACQACLSTPAWFACIGCAACSCLAGCCVGKCGKKHISKHFCAPGPGYCGLGAAGCCISFGCLFGCGLLG